jgi:large subunit ribosomal protein L13
LSDAGFFRVRRFKAAKTGGPEDRRTANRTHDRRTKPRPSALTRLGGAPKIAPLFVDRFGSGQMRTFSAKPEEVKHAWYVVDATDKVLGRLAAEIARRLRGKHKAIYTPHVDTGDYIVVVNAEKLRVTGAKAEDKKYYRYTGYPGGIRETTFGKMHARFPNRALEMAVKGMLPKGPLGYAMLRKLKVYGGGSHPHTAQQPKSLEI